MKNRSITTGKIKECPRCKKMMERKEHSRITEQMLKQPYYFTEWDYCNKHAGGCGYMQMYENKKVFNRNKARQKLDEVKEYLDIKNHFLSL